jgi:hypothetical protein
MAKLCVPTSIYRFGIFICSIFLAASLSAQITNIAPDQTPPIEGAGHDYIKMLNETVNPATGAVSIRIGVPVPPQSGFFCSIFDWVRLKRSAPCRWRGVCGQ